MDRLIRLLRIINIIQANPGIKAKELADICETSERSIYRDLDLLSQANFPIINEGHGKGYKFMGKFKQYPLNWDEDELNAFTLLPVLLEEKFKTKSFTTAYEKVMAAHKARKLDRESLVSDISKIIQSGKMWGPQQESNFLPQISEAILSTYSIEAIYHTQSRNITSTRKIDPYYLMPRNNQLYIIGYCHKSNDIRTFRLSRFQDVKVLNQKFTRDHLNLEKYLHHTWSIIRGDNRITFKIIFSQNIARYIKEEEYNVAPTFTDLPDGCLLSEVTVNDDREFLRWVMQYGSDAEIIEPLEYRVKMKDLLEKWTKKYQDKNNS